LFTPFYLYPYIFGSVSSLSGSTYKINPVVEGVAVSAPSKNHSLPAVDRYKLPVGVAVRAVTTATILASVLSPPTRRYYCVLPILIFELV